MTPLKAPTSTEHVGSGLPRGSEGELGGHLLGGGQRRERHRCPKSRAIGSGAYSEVESAGAGDRSASRREGIPVCGCPGGRSASPFTGGPTLQ
jgi:hypothetical protein